MRAFSAPFTPRPVGTVVCATTLRSPGSVATTRRAPDRGRLVSRRDQNVIAFWLGSPEATPSWKAPGPMRRLRGNSCLAQAGGTAATAPTAPIDATSSRRVRWTLLIGEGGTAG